MGTLVSTNADTVPFNMFIDEIENLLGKIAKLERHVERLDNGW